MNLLKKFIKPDNADFGDVESEDEIYGYVAPQDLEMEDGYTAAESNPSAFHQPAQTESRPVSADKVSLKLLKPKSHAEAPAIADKLKEGCIVLLDISNLKKEYAIRLVDFLAGVAYVLGGEMIKTNKHTIVVSPSGVDISNFAPEAEEEEYEEVEEAEDAVYEDAEL